MGSVGEMAAILRRFGDEESTLLDKYERLSFEVQLNQAILGRSLSEPSTLAPPPQAQVSHVRGGGGGRLRKLGFQKVLRKLLRPILGGTGRPARKDVRDHQKDIKHWKTFSRSLRF